MIGEALAFTATHRRNRAVGVVVSKSLTKIIAEIIFRQITVQVLFGTVLVDALHSALEDRKIAFNRIRRHVAARIFLRRMIYGFVRRKLLADAEIQFAFIGLQPRLTIDVV